VADLGDSYIPPRTIGERHGTRHSAVAAGSPHPPPPPVADPSLIVNAGKGGRANRNPQRLWG